MMNWILLAFISALFSAVSAVSEKKALFKLGVLEFSFIVSVITLLFSFPFFAEVQYDLVIRTEILILFVKTLMGAAAFLCVMKSIKDLEISEALPLLALTPGFVALAGVVFINDNLNLMEWLGIMLMFTGTYMLEIRKRSRSIFEPFRSFLNFNKYSCLFAALALFTVSSVLDRLLLRDFQLPPYTFIAFQQTFYALIFTLVILIKRGSLFKSVKNLDQSTFFIVILIALFTLVYRYTQIEATRLAPAALVLSIKRLSVLMAVILGGALFKDENLTIRISAAAVILAGTTLILIA